MKAIAALKDKLSKIESENAELRLQLQDHKESIRQYSEQNHRLKSDIRINRDNIDTMDEDLMVVRTNISKQDKVNKKLSSHACVLHDIVDDYKIAIKDKNRRIADLKNQWFTTF